MELKIGVLFVKIYQEELVNNVEKDGIITLIPVLKKKDGQNKKMRLSFKLRKSKFFY